jgi:diguanylate cyclase (GGDEF)-like protein
MFAFGLKLNLGTIRIPAKNSRLLIGVAAILLLLAVLAHFRHGLPDLRELEIRVRNLWCFPAGVIAGLGLFRLSRNRYENVLPIGYRQNFMWCGYTLIAYGVLAGIVAPKGQFLFSPYINNESFFAFIGAPVHLFRTAAALLISYFLIRAMALRISQRLFGILCAFFVMFFILAFTGYISISVIGKSYEKTVTLSAEQRDHAYLLRIYDRLFNVSQNLSLSANKRAYRHVSDVYLRELRAAIGEARSRSAPKSEAENDDEAWEQATFDRIDVLLERQTSKKGGLNTGDLNETKALLEGLANMHQFKIDQTREEMAQEVSNFTIFRVALFFASVAGFGFIGYAFHRTLIRPLNTLQTGATQLAKGNLAHKIHIGTADELQDLARDFNKMAESLLDRTGRLTKEAITDGLTGLFNHKHFHSRLEFEINRAVRARSPLSILLIDVDNFKQYNDRHGHPKGDEALRKCAAAICDHIRTVDIAARYGGEEFSIILAETDKNGALVVAENIRHAIEELRFPDGEEGGPTHGVTASIGISTYPADTKKMNELIKFADDALYTAKRTGKNRVCAHVGCIPKPATPV